MRWPVIYSVSFILISTFFVLIVWDTFCGLVRSAVGETEDWRKIQPVKGTQDGDDSPATAHEAPWHGFAYRDSGGAEEQPAGAAKGTLENLRRRHRRRVDLRYRTFSNNQPNRSWRVRDPRIR